MESDARAADRRTVPQRWRRRRPWSSSIDLLGVLAAIAGSVLLAACGGDDAATYDEDNRTAFMASCTDSIGDDLLQQRVCLCTYEELTTAVPFDRFAEIDDVLADADGEDAELPEDVMEVLARCVIEEGDL